MIDRENDVMWVEIGILGGGVCFEGFKMNLFLNILR